MADDANPLAAGFDLDLTDKSLFLFPIFDFREFDLDQFMPKEAFVYGPDHPLRHPLFADLNDRLQAVGEALQVFLLESP